MALEWNQFLDDIAIERCLSGDTEVFKAKFPKPTEIISNDQIVACLNMSMSVVKKRLGKIYEKFDLSGNGRGKDQKLQEQLVTRFNLPHAPQTPNLIATLKRYWQSQKHCTINGLMVRDGVTFQADDLFVPIGLKEWLGRDTNTQSGGSKTQRLPKEFTYQHTNTQSGGSKTQRLPKEFTYQRFLDEAIAQRNTPNSRGKRLAILGEPGAGKTTLLQKIGDQLESNGQVPIWISLARLGSKSLRQYLLEDWLRDVSQTLSDVPAEWIAALESLLKSNRVCLLLDGVDEMGQSGALASLGQQLQEGWIASIPVILTSRSNVWASGALVGFDAYQVLEFIDHRQIEQFIDQFFGRENSNPTLGNSMKTALTNRVRDLAKSPLRLSLLCYIWELGAGELPVTKAALYGQVVEHFYRLKQPEFPISPDEQHHLNHALGELAKRAIDEEGGSQTAIHPNESRFRLRESFIKQLLGEPEQEGSLFWQARRWGWLNQSGLTSEHPIENVYTFWHPTVQEYFAALAINDGCYLFNHISNDISQGNYRIFRPEWQEVFLLWLGLDNIDSQSRYDVLSKLSNFEDNCGGHYTEIAKYLVVKGSNEFKEFDGSRHIVEQFCLDCFQQSLSEPMIYIDSRYEQREEIISILKQANKELFSDIFDGLLNGQFSAAEDLYNRLPEDMIGLPIHLECSNLYIKALEILKFIALLDIDIKPQWMKQVKSILTDEIPSLDDWPENRGFLNPGRHTGRVIISAAEISLYLDQEFDLAFNSLIEISSQICAAQKGLIKYKHLSDGKLDQNVYIAWTNLANSKISNKISQSIERYLRNADQNSAKYKSVRNLLAEVLLLIDKGNTLALESLEERLKQYDQKTLSDLFENQGLHFYETQVLVVSFALEKGWLGEWICEDQLMDTVSDLISDKNCDQNLVSFLLQLAKNIGKRDDYLPLTAIKRLIDNSDCHDDLIKILDDFLQGFSLDQAIQDDAQFSLNEKSIEAFLIFGILATDKLNTAEAKPETYLKVMELATSNPDIFYYATQLYLKLELEERQVCANLVGFINRYKNLSSLNLVNRHELLLKPLLKLSCKGEIVQQMRNNSYVLRHCARNMDYKDFYAAWHLPCHPEM